MPQDRHGHRAGEEREREPPGDGADIGCARREEAGDHARGEGDSHEDGRAHEEPQLLRGRGVGRPSPDPERRDPEGGGRHHREPAQARGVAEVRQHAAVRDRVAEEAQLLADAQRSVQHEQDRRGDGQPQRGPPAPREQPPGGKHERRNRDERDHRRRRPFAEPADPRLGRQPVDEVRVRRVRLGRDGDRHAQRGRAHQPADRVSRHPGDHQRPERQQRRHRREPRHQLEGPGMPSAGHVVRGDQHCQREREQ